LTDLRDRILKIQGELANGALSPDLARESLVRLTALIGNVQELERKADHEYKLVLLGCMSGGEPANRAKIRAEVSEQYVRWREWKDLSILMIEMVRTCKKYMQSLEEEMRMTPR